MKVELKNVRIASNLSRETIAFTASLWIDGKKQASVENSGHGGPNECHFDDKEVERAFYEHCRSQPDVPCDFGDGTPLKMNSDFFISRMIGKYDEEQWMKRQTRTKVLFRREGDDEGYRQISLTQKGQKYTRKAVMDFLNNKYSDIVEMH